MRRELRIRVAFAVLVYLMLEAVSLAGLAVLRRTRGISFFPKASVLAPEGPRNLDRFLANSDETSMALDSVLGWRPRPGSEINAAGMRDDREYPREPSATVLRISAFGDSFTYGEDVPLAESWAKRMPAIDSTVEVLNYGVGAYGLDQAYLRYLREGREYRPHVVFIGFMSENIARDVNVFRPFYNNGYSDWFFSKPRFRVDDGKLVLLPNPLRTIEDYRRLRDDQEQVLRELGRHDHYFVGEYRAGPADLSPTVRLSKLAVAGIRRALPVPVFTADGRYEPRSEAYQVTQRIFDAFYRKVLENGALPVIVVFPDLHDQRRSRDGKPRRYESMLGYFRSSGYRYLDVLSAFEPVESRHTVEDLTVQWGHFSAIGNDLVARYLLAALAEWGFDEAPKADSAAAVERRRLGVLPPSG